MRGERVKECHSEGGQGRWKPKQEAKEEKEVGEVPGEAGRSKEYEDN